MSLRTILKTAFCLSALLISSQTHATAVSFVEPAKPVGGAVAVPATEVNFNGYDLDIGTVNAGQYGVINRFAGALEGKGLAEGLLPPNTKISFTYNFGLSLYSSRLVSLNAASNYFYTDPADGIKYGGIHDESWVVDSSDPEGGYTVKSHMAMENNRYVNKYPMVDVSVDGLTLTTIIENTSKVATYFRSRIATTYGSGVDGFASYNVSSVPLPAALPLFGLGLIALGARRKFKNKSC